MKKNSINVVWTQINIVHASSWSNVNGIDSPAY